MDIKKQVEHRVQSEINNEVENEIENKLHDPAFIQKCEKNNVVGDAEIFKILFPGHFLFNKAMDCWLFWDDHHWSIDWMDFAAASVQSVAVVYDAEVKKCQQQLKIVGEDDSQKKALKSKIKRFERRAAFIRDPYRVKKILTMVHTSKNPAAITGIEIDQMPWKVPCKSGVINLKTGDLEPGRQSDFLLKASPVTWPVGGIETKAERWESFLYEIMSGRQELVNFLQRICGMAVIGEVREGVFIVLSGRGRNGKSLFVKILSKILGPLAGVIRPEMLLNQNRMANPSGPSPEIMSLRGRRVVFASETDDGCRISPSRVKWLTGDDVITGRDPHDKYEVEFNPTHTLFLLTNHKPHAPADDFAFWERVILINFETSFVSREPTADNEKKADPYLAKKLEEELSGIFAWMVRGCLEYQKQGLNPPIIVRDAVSEYRRDEDTLADFIEECCILGEQYSVNSSDVYGTFSEWWQSNVSTKVPSFKWFGTLFSKKFEKRKTPAVRYYGVGLLEDSTLFPKGGAMLEVMFFYNQDPDSLCDEINRWMEKTTRKGPVEVVHIKQTCLPPDNYYPDTAAYQGEAKPDINSYLVISLWYKHFPHKN